MSSIAIYIEADQGNTLGGSCIRDLYNMANAVAGIISAQQHHVFTHCKLNAATKHRFPSGTIFHEHSKNPLRAFEGLVNRLSGTGTLFVVISGHGYQTRDVSGDELDGYDEHIRIQGITILDDDLRHCFIDNLPLNMRFVGIIDTCHSGTMFDLDYSWNGHQWDRARKGSLSMYDESCDSVKAVTIAACRDSQLENCDVGDTTGFGGALCVHLIEKGLLSHVCKCDKSSAIYVYNCLKTLFSLMNQEPIIQMNLFRK